MKMKRLLASVLALLLVVSILPMTALAADNPAGETIDTNTGNIGINYGTIGTNEGGVQQNDGTIGTNEGGVEYNRGTIGTNEGFVVQNEGTIGTNNDYVGQNNGTIGINNDRVVQSDGTIGTNNYRVEQNGNKITTNNGSVNRNTLNGTIETNNGTVEANSGKVETNGIDGDVTNLIQGSVDINFGTVYNNDGTTCYGLSWGDNVQSLTLIDGNMPGNSDPVNLNDYAAKASRSGYKMTGYTAYSRTNGADTQIEKPSEHVMNAPVWLLILWEELAVTSEPQPTRTPVYTNLSADQVRVGAFLRLGNCVFKIIEVNDDSIRVSTVNKLPEEALADMLGFLKQYLSDAQIAKLIGEPELLEQELVSQFFGGSDDHIAFYASRDLFANEIS